MKDQASLPPPKRDGPLSLEATLDRRRTCREFTAEPLEGSDTAQLVWAAQGLNAHGRRTAPSAGALYPLETYTVTAEAVAHYDPIRHRLEKVVDGDLRPELAQSAVDQEFLAQAPLTVVLSAVDERITRRYGAARGPRYIHMEAGHAAQNVLLQAVSLGLGAAPVGAFDDQAVGRLLRLPADHHPLYLLPIGHPRHG